MLGLAGSCRCSGSGSGAGLSPWTLACLRALVSAAMFLAGTLGPSWFGVLEALQNADYVSYDARYGGSRRHNHFSQTLIRRAFSCEILEDSMFRDFVGASSLEMVGIQGAPMLALVLVLEPLVGDRWALRMNATRGKRKKSTLIYH